MPGLPAKASSELSGKVITEMSLKASRTRGNCSRQALGMPSAPLGRERTQASVAALQLPATKPATPSETGNAIQGQRKASSDTAS